MKKYGEKVGAKGVGAADPNAISFEGHMHIFEDLVKSVKNGTKPFVDGAEARKSVEIILAIYQSALKGGKEVKLPLKKSPKLIPFK